jgi:hypothetical protein
VALALWLAQTADVWVRARRKGLDARCRTSRKAFVNGLLLLGASFLHHALIIENLLLDLLGLHLIFIGSLDQHLYELLLGVGALLALETGIREMILHLRAEDSGRLDIRMLIRMLGGRLGVLIRLEVMLILRSALHMYLCAGVRLSSEVVDLRPLVSQSLIDIILLVE